MGIFFIPTIVFMVVVAPIWLILHYWTQSRMNRGLSSEERTEMDNALALAQKLEQRIATLETILDVQQPDWRHHDEDRNQRT
jgi:phage shock protein B